MTVEGIDISEWQTETPDLANVGFVIVRATFGGVTDTRWAMHSDNVLAAKKVLGAYHFGYGSAILSPEAQADAFLAAVGETTRWLMLDDETSPTPMLPIEAERFIARVHTKGRRCGLYHSLSGFFDAGQDWNAVAAWQSSPPSIPYDVWQYGRSHIVGTNIDGDIYKGTLAELQVLAEGDSMFPVVTVTLFPEGPRHFTVPAGTTLSGYDPARPNTPLLTHLFPAESGATADGTVSVTWVGTTTPPIPKGGPFLRVTDGSYAGLLIVASLVKVDAPPSTPAIDLTPALTLLNKIDSQVSANGSSLSALNGLVSAIKAKTDKDLA